MISTAFILIFTLMLGTASAIQPNETVLWALPSVLSNQQPVARNSRGLFAADFHHPTGLHSFERCILAENTAHANSPSELPCSRNIFEGVYGLYHYQPFHF